MRSNHRGTTLGTVMLVLVIALVLLFMMAQASTVHLGFVGGLDNQQHARNLAEAAVAEGLERVLEDQASGRDRQAGRAVQVSGDPYPQGAFGYLSFNQAEGSSLPGGWYSTNNLAGTASVPGDRRAVPRGTVHLVGVGRCGSSAQAVEVLYYRPPFPRGASASGPIAASELAVIGLAPGASYPGTPDAVPAADRAASSLQSNDASRAPPAIDLLSGCRVLGDVAAAGGIRLHETAYVGGEVRPGGDPQPLPEVNLEALFTQLGEVSGAVDVPPSTGSLQVDWVTRAPSGLNVSGDLELEEGVLVVRGDLSVAGAVRGRGLILASGEVRLLGGAELDAQNLVAVACGGDVVLRGGDRADYYFQGLIYTEGNLDAQDLTVLGTLVANGGGMRFERVNLVQTPVSLQQVFPVPQMAAETEGNPPNGGADPTWVSVWPVPDGNGGTPVFKVRVVDVVGQNFDQTWEVPPATLAGIKSYVDTRVSHNAAVKATLDRMAARVNSPTNPYVVPLDANNLLSPTDRSRILLWRAL